MQRFYTDKINTIWLGSDPCKKTFNSQDFYFTNPSKCRIDCLSEGFEQTWYSTYIHTLEVSWQNDAIFLTPIDDMLIHYFLRRWQEMILYWSQLLHEFAKESLQGRDRLHHYFQYLWFLSLWQNIQDIQGIQWIPKSGALKKRKIEWEKWGPRKAYIIHKSMLKWGLNNLVLKFGKI